MILKDKICVVTGAAQGIGKAIAIKMLSEGAVVYGCDRQEGSMDSMAEENDRFHPLYFDVTDQKGAKEAMMRVRVPEYGGWLADFRHHAEVVEDCRPASD